MKELAIGEELHIRCVEDIPEEARCINCCFRTNTNCNNIKCCGYERNDHKSVHFEIIEN